MKKLFLIFFALLAPLPCGRPAAAATLRDDHNKAGALPKQQPTPSPQQPSQRPPQQQQPSQPSSQQPSGVRTAPRPAGFELAEYGVEIEAEPRLIVMMAALDAAGWDPTPAGAEPSVFRQTVRKDSALLDPTLRRRLQDFYRSRLLPETTTPEGKVVPRTPAEQAARYVSLAYTLGPAPSFESPVRADDLPGGVLDVLDFVPLMREFYAKSGMGERLPAYVRQHLAEGDRLRRPTAEMVRGVLTYLRVRPTTTVIESLAAADSARSGGKKKGDDKRGNRVLREKARRFLIVPDLLAAPGAINFRVIRDDYFAIIPHGTDPTSSDLRRGYIQYLVDPLVLRYGRDLSAKRDALRLLLEEVGARTKRTLTPDVFLAASRSLVAATDARMDEAARLRDLELRTSRRLREATDEATRAAAARESQAERARIEDATVAQLADSYERGAVLSFYFNDQLRGLETSGFDISNFFSDMIVSVDPAREGRRPAEYAEAVKRHREARERALREREASDAAGGEQRSALVKKLSDVDDLLGVKNYAEAESRLRVMVRDYPREPRVYFALGQAASLSAQDAFDPDLQTRRLTLALDFYRQAITAADASADAAIISRARAASGRILVFLERNEEATKEFDAAIAVGDVAGGAYREALAERKKLTPQP